MKIDLGLKTTPCISIILALFLTYTLIDELQDSASLSEFSILPLFIFIVVIANAIWAFLLLIGSKKPKKEFFILQIFIIVPTSLLLYQILFNSTISD